MGPEKRCSNSIDYGDRINGRVDVCVGMDNYRWLTNLFDEFMESYFVQFEGVRGFFWICVFSGAANSISSGRR